MGGTELTKRSNRDANTLQKLMDWQHFYHCASVCNQPSKCPENHRQPSQGAEGLVPLSYSVSPAPFLTAVNAMGLHRHCPGPMDMKGAHQSILFSPSWAVIKPHLGCIRWNRGDAVLRQFCSSKSIKIGFISFPGGNVIPCLHHEAPARVKPELIA